MTSTATHTVFLGLGSNIGDSVGHLRAALAALGPLCGGWARASRFYTTEARMDLDQDVFLNCVAQLEVQMDPTTFLLACQAIEAELGRRRDPSRPKGPRVIDIDILLFGDLVIETEALTVPHPGLAERRFVLEPLAELAPAAIHPVMGRSVASLLAECRDMGWVKPLTLPDSG